MKTKRLKILKTILTRALGFNSESISETFSQMGIVFLGALLGGFASISLSKDSTSVKTWLILILIFFIMSIFFGIIKHRALFKSLFKEFIQSE